ncbi:MAG: PLP-dependent aminotransferase family protein [Deltaproteobacteria bacterium]|nr:PLP-dependent aminotransferase family protein [Deltaproteobacteria bacterium]MDX9763212.1 PLP-dependent aminotransferase family protein [Desulfomonilia bacterium]HPW69881.1 PLP-dependent aminotransferase family protein [Deltaproteobacteria bacterium]
MSEKQSINFLRGVPAEEALSRLIPLASEGYEKVIRRYGTDVLQYGHFTGFKPLRELIGRLHRVDPERVIVGNGGLEVISLFFKSLPRNSTIIVEEASYDRALLDAMCYGHHLIGVQLTRGGVDLNQLKNVAKKNAVAAFYGIPFHQNPTGINYTEENRKEVERICREHGIPCVWDICYQALRYDGKANDSIEVSEWGPILTNSFTKTISPGTKCGYMIVPTHYVGHLSGIIANTRINPNLPTQAFIADFIESGGYDDFVKYLRNLYKPKMEALNTALHSFFPGAFPVTISGGFFAPLTLENISGDKEVSFIESAKHAGVGVAAAWNAFAPNWKEEKHKKGLFIRLTFPAFQPDRIAWGISMLKETAERLA